MPTPTTGRPFSELNQVNDLRGDDFVPILRPSEPLPDDKNAIISGARLLEIFDGNNAAPPGPSIPLYAGLGPHTDGPIHQAGATALFNRSSNYQRGGPFYVSYRSITQPGYEPGASTLADIPEALICFGARAYVSLSDDGPDSEYVPAFDYPAGPLHINKDGFFGPDNNIPARWVLKDSQEAADSNIRVIDNIISDWRLNETGKALISGTYYYFGANAAGGPFTPPTTIAGTADWHAEAPPLAQHQFYQAITVPVAQAIALADTAIQPITYRILRGSDGTSRKGDIVVQGIAFSPGTESTEADVPARFATIGQWLDPDTEQWGMAFYDVATDTVEPVDFPRLAAQAASITRRNYDDVLSGESSISAAATWLGDDRTVFLNSPKFVLTEPVVFVNGIVRGNGAAIQATSFLFSVSGTSFFDTTVDGGTLTVDGSNTLFTGGQAFAQTIRFAASSSQLFLRDVPAASVAAVTVAGGVTGCVIVLQNSTEWPDSLSLPAGVTLRDERPKAVFVAIPANHWGAGDPPAPLLTVNAAIEHLHGHLSNSPAGGQLAPPANPQASAVSTTAISTAASSVANAMGYQLFASDTQNGIYTQIGGVLLTPAYTETGLAPAQVRWYKWRAQGDGTLYTDSAFTASVQGTTLANAGAFRGLYIAFGNSQTQGDNYNAETGDNSYPAQAQPLLPAGWDVLNKGGNGRTFAMLSAAVATDITPYINFTTYNRNVVSIQEFANSLASLTAAEAYDACMALVAQIQAIDARIEIALITGYPRYDAAQPSAYDDYNAAMNAINARLRTDFATTSSAKWLWDIRTSQYLDTDSKAQNPLILADGTHGTRALNTVMAHLVVDGLSSPAGVVASTYVLTTSVAPTIGGTVHGTAVPTAPNDAAIRIIAGAFIDAGSFRYCGIANVSGSPEPAWQVPYEEGIELSWGNGNPAWEGVTLEFYKNGDFSAPVHTAVTANGALLYADYPTDGLNHSVTVVARNTPANDGKFNIIWPFTRYR